MELEKRHVIVDLETLGTSSNSVILSIGAVSFSQSTGMIGSFFTAVEEASCFEVGLVSDTATELWWSKQSEEAKAQFKNPIPLKDVLNLFSEFIEQDDRIWGNGADFDNVILANAYKACGIKTPWKYKNNRCYRTMKAMFPEVKTPRFELQHHALQDAKYQTRHLMAILKEMERCQELLK